MPFSARKLWASRRTPIRQRGCGALSRRCRRNFLRITSSLDRALVRSAIHSAGLLRRPLGDVLERMELPTGSVAESPPIDAVVKEAIRFVENLMTVDRTDRIFPADPAVFSTNPWSVAYGAAGAVRALHQLTGCLPPALEQWLRVGQPPSHRRHTRPAFLYRSWCSPRESACASG